MGETFSNLGKSVSDFAQTDKGNMVLSGISQIGDSLQRYGQQPIGGGGSHIQQPQPPQVNTDALVPNYLEILWKRRQERERQPWDEQLPSGVPFLGY